MAYLIKEYDLNKSIKSQTFKLTKDSENKITFKNDIEGQVVYKELNNKIAIEVYATTNTTHSYTKTVIDYDIKHADKQCAVISTKYVWAKVGDEYAWKKENTKNYNIDPDNIPANLDETKHYQVEYVMTSKDNNSESKLSSGYALADPDSKDESYKTIIIDKYGLVSKTLTENVEATIYLDKGNIASKMLLEAVNISERDLLTQTYAPQRKGNKYTGMYLNEVVTSSEANETFDLKTGNDEIYFAFADGVGKVGNDVINLVKDEILTLKMMNSTDNDSIDTPNPDAEFLVNTSYTKKGNDLVMKYTNKYDDVLGQTTIKNYFKIAQDNITMKYSGASSSVVDYDYSLKEYLELQDGVGIIGDDEAKTAQKLTGNFLDNILLGGKGNDTIKGVAGDNFVIAGEGDDILYSGKDSDSFFIHRGDAAGSKGDTVYNAASSDSVYFYDSDDMIDSKLNPDHFEFTKKGNTLTINYNDKPGDQNSKTDKVTFVDYFKRNTELFNINDATDYSTLKINQTAKGTVKGTNYGDDITLTGKSNVYTGDGNDTVRFYYQTGDTHKNTTHVVDKNVNVYINGTGKKTFERTEGYGDEGGDMGNKTIVFQNEASKTAVAKFNLLGSGSGTQPTSQGYIYAKSGNNLVVEGYYTNTTDYHYDPLNATYDSYGSYTVKDYFKSGNNVGTVYIDGDDDNHKLDLTKVDFLYQQGKKNKAATFYDTKYNDYILGGSKNDKYYFTQGNVEYKTDKAVDIKGNDTYNVANLSNSLIIYDKAGSRDKLVISDTKDYSLYFDITLNSTDNTKIGSVGKDLHIYNKNTNKNGVTITNHIAYSDNTVKTGAGCIESIKVDGKTLDINTNLQSVASAVANWLGKETDFMSTEALLNGGTAEEISTMLNIYTTGQSPN